jgi:hypothetical protein
MRRLKVRDREVGGSNPLAPTLKALNDKNLRQVISVNLDHFSACKLFCKPLVRSLVRFTG